MYFNQVLVKFNMELVGNFNMDNYGNNTEERHNSMKMYSFRLFLVDKSYVFTGYC